MERAGRVAPLRDDVAHVAADYVSRDDPHKPRESRPSIGVGPLTRERRRREEGPFAARRDERCGGVHEGPRRCPRAPRPGGIVMHLVRSGSHSPFRDSGRRRTGLDAGVEGVSLVVRRQDESHASTSSRS